MRLYTDPATGRLYYVDPRTGESRCAPVMVGSVPPVVTERPRRSRRGRRLGRWIGGLVAFGVIGATNDEKALRKDLEFCKEMGIGEITCEPAADAWPLVDKLVQEYKMEAACHNHPKRDGYKYWNPDYVLEAIKGLSASCGACADVGHMVRSKLSPVESLKKYEGRLISLHLKDIKEVKGEMIDQPWGTGTTDIAAVLKELRRQKFAGYMSVEYEDGAGKELEANVRKCIEHFDALCVAMVAAEAKAPSATK